MNSTLRPAPPQRGDYACFRPITPRWADNDVYGRVNNAVYCSYFDTAVNGFLIEAGVLDIHGGATIGLVVQTQCHDFAPISFSQPLKAGLRVARLGRSSVRYEIGLFAADAASAAAAGHSCTSLSTARRAGRWRCCPP